MNAEPFHVALKQWLPTLVLVPLVGFMLYRRFKTTFGRQLVSRTKLRVRLGLLALIGVFVLVTAQTVLGAAIAGGGLVVGVGLAIWGVRHTQFELLPTESYYTPNKWIGLAVTALFLGRLAARFLTVYQSVAQPGGTSVDLHRSPATAAILLLMVGYYVAYYAAILHKTRAA